MKKDWLSISLAFFAFALPWQLKLIWRPGEIKGLASNFLEIAFYGFALALLLFIALAIYQITVTKKWPKIWSKENLLLAGLLVCLLFSCFFGSNKFLALSYYFYFLIGAILFFCSRLLSKAIDWNLVVKVFLVSCLFSAVLGIFQFTIQKVPTIKYFVSSHQVSEFAGDSVLEIESGRLLRAYGSFDHPNIFGGVMVIALLLVVDLIFKTKKKKEWQGLMLMLIIFFWALLVSFSRAAWLAFLVAMLVRLAFNYRYELFKIMMIFAVGLAVSFMFFSSHLSWLFARVSGTGRLENMSINERWLGLSNSFSQIVHQPFSPVGLGNYLNFSIIKFPSLQAWQYQPVHNVWLLLAVESGWWTAVLLLVFWISTVKKNQAFTASLVAALLVVSLLDHWLVSLPFGILFSFLVLSMASEETI
ncbi:MAG: O-antigen ligase family protein [Candidatus Falkowbacteria bacterium]|nr:O-antigen ligase family protein [Candidatus Falkowbacteria bacterium]